MRTKRLRERDNLTKSEQKSNIILKFELINYENMNSLNLPVYKLVYIWNFLVISTI